MSDLDAAIDNLRDARPDPAAVERLASETIRKRETPYAPENLFTSWSVTVGKHSYGYQCMVCGSVVLGSASDWLASQGHTKVHLDWHNRTESRLRKLEAGS